MDEESHDSINGNRSESHRLHHQWFLRSWTAHHNRIGTIYNLSILKDKACLILLLFYKPLL